MLCIVERDSNKKAKWQLNKITFAIYFKGVTWVLLSGGTLIIVDKVSGTMLLVSLYSSYAMNNVIGVY